MAGAMRRKSMRGNTIVYYEEANGTDIESGFVIKSMDYMQHVAEFKTEKQLQEFAALLGFTYEWDEVKPGRRIGHCSHVIVKDAKDEEIISEYKRLSLLGACGIYSDDPAQSAAAKEWLNMRFDIKPLAYRITAENLSQAKEIKALSNGSVVDCLFVNDGETVRIYRCLPGARLFYKPMPLEEHIEYQRVHGVY